LNKNENNKRGLSRDNKGKKHSIKKILLRRISK